MKKMRKIALGTVIGGSMLAAVGFGTAAQFGETFSSKDNAVQAANFSVENNWGELGKDGSSQFNIDKLAPGKGGMYQFGIDTRGSDVPVMLDVKADVKGALAGGNSPVQFKLVNTTGDTYHVIDEDASDGLTFTTTDSVQTYAVEWYWPEDTDRKTSNKFAGKTAKVNIEVDANQVIEKELTTTIWSKATGTINGVNVKFNDEAKVEINYDGKTYVASYNYMDEKKQVQVNSTSELTPVFGSQGINIKVPDGFVK
ncbi:hypothetical protein J0K78_12555 [Halobacillus sp. GSS1]|uniref:hypothetical protein n=1 Tax=Halobacillus sp. GSS1 TaxID=2815919 RepID=UPI001A8C3A7D|nr:hypothetical protein [Halobacillus sp. GSS1]MBN9655103.1 hypothetical protein [Halobacillus sp. GSS1]